MPNSDLKEQVLYLSEMTHHSGFSDKTFKRLMICIASNAICQTESISLFLKTCSERFLNIKLQNFVRFGCPASLDIS